VSRWRSFRSSDVAESSTWKTHAHPLPTLILLILAPNPPTVWKIST
jgi:hypothetical protein